SFHVDRAIHFLDQPFADGKAQPRSWMPAGRRAVDLPERIENVRHRLCRHTDPGIGDLKLPAAGVETAGCDRDTARLFGKFDRITDQIYQNLLDFAGVAEDHFRQVVGKVDAEADLFFQRQTAQTLHTVLNDDARRHRRKVYLN